jgi:hypothetical protein
MKLVALLLSAPALVLACVGQQPATAPTPTKPFVLEAGEILLSDLIDRSAPYLGWNILSHNQEMASAGGATTIRLQNRIETDVAGCEELLASMLWRSGFALTTLDESKRLYEIINASGPRSREITTRAVSKTPEQVLARPNLKVPVMTAVELKHINATIATNALRPFFASTGGAQGGAQLTLGNVGNNTAVLVLGMQDQVASALRILKTCDVPAAAGEPALLERLDAIERRLQALEQKLGAAQPGQGR